MRNVSYFFHSVVFYSSGAAFFGLTTKLLLIHQIKNRRQVKNAELLPDN